MRAISVDPGVSGTGYVLWESLCTTKVTVLSFGVLASKEKQWAARAAEIGRTVADLAREAKVSRVWCELPAYWGTFKQHSWAAQGSLVKQAVLVGTMLAVPWVAKTVRIVSLVPVADWKGQLPKPVVEARVRKILGGQSRGFESHAWDAAGIGLYSFQRMGVDVGW